MARASTPPSRPTKGATGTTESTPKKVRWYTQVWTAYQMTRKHDPAITWLILAVFVGIVAIGLVLGLLLHSLIYMLVLSIPFAALGAMFVLARRAETAAYTQIEGQPGASRAALGTIRKGWTFAEEPVAVDPRTQDLVFRGLGRAGVVLVSEGPASRAGKLLEQERKRTARVISGAPITLMQMGDEPGQVPLRKLPRAVQKLRPQLTKAEVDEVSKRLTALGGMRLPMPKGIDPTRMRPDRRGLRGR